jgi:isoquinoline 1-oxidoreductase beta subunit
VPANPKLKDRAQFKLLGKPVPRLDTPGKLNGTAQYGIDTQVDGLLVAVMARAPLPGTKVASLDDSKAKAIKGVQHVFQIDNGVAVLADGYWAAKKGRDALVIQWDLGELNGLSSERISGMLIDAARKADKVARNDGDVDTAAAKAKKTVKAQYAAPYLAHACMEPLNCTAQVTAEGVEIWAGTQNQGPLQGAIAQAAGVPPANVKINTMLLGGGFGRRFAPDFTVDAVLSNSAATGEADLFARGRHGGRLLPARRGGAVRGRSGCAEEAGDAQGRHQHALDHGRLGFHAVPENGVDAMALEG